MPLSLMLGNYSVTLQGALSTSRSLTPRFLILNCAHLHVLFTFNTLNLRRRTRLQRSLMFLAHLLFRFGH